MSCDGAACSAEWYGSTVSVSVGHVGTYHYHDHIGKALLHATSLFGPHCFVRAGPCRAPSGSSWARAFVGPGALTMWAHSRQASSVRARSRRVLMITENIALGRDHRAKKQVLALLAAGWKVSFVCRRDADNEPFRSMEGL